jgi:hypothetical protein
MALPDTGSSRTTILRGLLDKANIKYNTCGRELIVTANSYSLGCVGNVILDIQIDRGKRLAIDALVADNLSSDCLIAWKDMQRAGLISPLFPAKVHLTKVAPAVIDRRVSFGPCLKPNLATTVHKAERPVRQRLEPHLAQTHIAAQTALRPINNCLESHMAPEVANTAHLPISPTLEPHLAKRTADTDSSAGQPIHPCLKQSLVKDTLESLLLEFKDVF